MAAIHQNTYTETSMLYQIRLRGHLGSQWSEWFEGFNIYLANEGDTFLIGPVADQASLHGLLKKVRDLGMPLLSLLSIPIEEVDEIIQRKMKTMDPREKEQFKIIH